MPSLDKWLPRIPGIRDPRDSSKRNGLFWNWPRYLYFGGAPQGVNKNQSGNKAPNVGAASGQQAVGPISDRGKGRR